MMNIIRRLDLAIDVLRGMRFKDVEKKYGLTPATARESFNVAYRIAIYRARSEGVEWNTVIPDGCRVTPITLRAFSTKLIPWLEKSKEQDDS